MNEWKNEWMNKQMLIGLYTDSSKKIKIIEKKTIENFYTHNNKVKIIEGVCEI